MTRLVITLRSERGYSAANCDGSAVKCPKTLRRLIGLFYDVKKVRNNYREGSSDKVYQCQIEQAGSERFLVNFAYGRRGGTLNTGTKTNVPVDYDDAQRIFDKLVREKQAKGYTRGPDSTPYQHTDKQPSGILPQLLNSIEERQVLDLMGDDKWAAQEKYDGRRLIVRKEGPAINGINKKGNLVGLPEPLFQAIQLYGGDVVIDGESVGDNYHAFDLLVLDGVDTPGDVAGSTSDVFSPMGDF